MPSLPSFLHPSTSGSLVEDAPYKHAIFQHKAPLAQAHCIWWPSTSPDASPQTVLMFVPGNPGLLGFYIPFLSSIYEKAPPSRFAILAHSHLGHTSGIDSSGYPSHPSLIQLAAQLDAILEVFDAVKDHYGAKTKVLFVGHSVGSWLALQAFKARSSDAAGCFFLFPTITGIADTPNGRLLSRMFRSPLPRIISHLSTLICWFPLRVLGLLFPSYPLHQLVVLRSLLQSRSAIYCMLTMADDEMNVIRDLDEVFLNQNHDRLWFYFAEIDGWVGDRRDVILRVFRDTSIAVRVVHGPRDIPHAFCINHGEELAVQCLDWLRSGNFV